MYSKTFISSNASPALKTVLAAFEEQGVTVTGGPDNFYTRCPCHDDTKASLSIADGADRVLFKCHASCDQDEMFNAVVNFIGFAKSDFFFNKKSAAGEANGPVTTVAELAAAKHLPVELLTWAGMRDSSEGIRVPYWDGSGPPRERIRRGLVARLGSFWGQAPYPDHKITAYGAWRMSEFRTAGHVYLVEGETDAITGWWYRLPVLGIPGKTMARSVIAHNPQLLQGINWIFVIEEPDDFEQRKFLQGVRRGLSDTHSSAQVFPMRLPEKDLSDLHVKRGPGGFWHAFQEAHATAVDTPNWPDALPLPPTAAKLFAIITTPGFPAEFKVRDVQRRDRSLRSAKISADLERLVQAKIVRRVPAPRAVGRPAVLYRINPKMVL